MMSKLSVTVLAGSFLLPAQLEARERRPNIGATAKAFTFKDIRYLPRTLDDLGPHKACVLVFTTTSCPLVQRYLPGLKELSAAYRDRDVQFVAVNVGADDSIKDIALQALEHQVDFPFVKDFDGQCARALGVQRTPEVVLLDADRHIRYRGRIDNQYRLGGVKPSADRHDLKEAIDDMLASRKIKKPETPVDGCAITFPVV